METHTNLGGYDMQFRLTAIACHESQWEGEPYNIHVSTSLLSIITMSTTE